MEYDAYVENAIEWAQTQLGSHQYDGWCLSFVEDAYEKGNGIEMFGGSSAHESAVEYGARENTGAPPRGAFVFYDCDGAINGEFKNWGHVGLVIESGKVIHAWQGVRVNEYLEVEGLEPPEGWTRPRYIGWVSVERVLRGYRKHE